MASLRSEVPAPTKQERLFYLDWLRVLAVLTVFFYHTLRPFDFTYWHVKNTDQSLAITILLFFFSCSSAGHPLPRLSAGRDGSRSP